MKQIPQIKYHPLCVVSALDQAFASVALSALSPAFVLDMQGTPMTGDWFNKCLKSLVKLCGFDPSKFASHSYRRGSASWAWSCGIPGEMVMRMGDWKSACYLNYLDQLPQELYDKELIKFCTNLPSS